MDKLTGNIKLPEPMACFVKGLVLFRERKPEPVCATVTVKRAPRDCCNTPFFYEVPCEFHVCHSKITDIGEDIVGTLRETAPETGIRKSLKEFLPLGLV